MKKFTLAYGAALASTVIGVANSILVVRAWSQDEAALYFQIASLAILVAVTGEAGLSSYALHDSARVSASTAEQLYVNRTLREAAARALPAGLLAFACGRIFFDFGVADGVWAGAATSGFVIAVVAQALFRGTGRDVVASVAGPVGATLASGVALAFGALTDIGAPIHLAAVGYAGVGVISAVLLWRPTGTPLGRRQEQLRVRRTYHIGLSNICNAAGRQLDVWIAGSLLAGAAFNSYALATKIAASVGIVSYAASQATATEVHRWVAGDSEAGRTIRRVYAIAFVAIGAVGISTIALAPTLGPLLFGDQIELSRSVLGILLLGYFLAATAGPAGMALVAADRAGLVLRASVRALLLAATVAALAAGLGGRGTVSALFVLTWLASAAILSAVEARRVLGLDLFVVAGVARSRDPSDR